MKLSKILLLNLTTILFLTSCNSNSNSRSYTGYSLSFEDLSDKEGYGFKYKYIDDVSKELGEKVSNIYNKIIESDESYKELKNDERSTMYKYYEFSFKQIYELDRFYISSENNDVYIYYCTDIQNIVFTRRCYDSLSESYLKEINELKSSFKDLLKDIEWAYDSKDGN